MNDLIKQLQNWSARVRSDIKAAQADIDNPDTIFVVNGLLKDTEANLDELDKMLSLDKVKK